MMRNVEFTDYNTTFRIIRPARGGPLPFNSVVAAEKVRLGRALHREIEQDEL